MNSQRSNHIAVSGWHVDIDLTQEFKQRIHQLAALRNLTKEECVRKLDTMVLRMRNKKARG